MWTRAATRFFAELEQDNTKAFFTANRARYDKEVRGPLEGFLLEAFEDFGEGKVFRPHRDTRFSKDKSPYKLECAALVGGRYYVQVDKTGVIAGGGMYHLERAQLQRFRRAVLADDALEHVVAALRAKGIEVAGEQLKRAPRGVDPDHPRIALLRHKGLVGLQRFGIGPDVEDRVLATWHDLRPLVAWLDEHVEGR